MVSDTTNNLPKHLTVKHLLKAGVHLGHTATEWFPSNAPFILGERNGTHILDLNSTYAQYRLALKFLSGVVTNGGSVCFVATNPDIARLLSVCLGDRLTNVGFLTRWFPGMLTNWSSVADFITRVESNPGLISLEKNPKNFRRWQSLKGLRRLGSLPDVLVLLHAKDTGVAIKEANQVNIPSIGIVDSNANGLGLTYPILGNDDSLEAQFLYLRVFCEILSQTQKESKVSPNKISSLGKKSSQVLSLKEQLAQDI